MYINAVAHYLPSQVVNNDYFLNVNGLSDKWIFQRTGIKQRRRAAANENSNSMGIEAVKAAISKIPYPISEVDLIVGATYTPHDTVGTLSHVIQREFNIKNAAAVTITSACSSLVNAVEIVEGYFALNKASKAIVVASENNTIYSNDSDEKSGHLWGDGAAVLFLSNEKQRESDMEIEVITTKGLGHVGKGPQGVYLIPKHEGIVMPFGKDVFVNACTYMIESLEKAMKSKGYQFSDITYLIPHQANMRIISQLAHLLNFPQESIFANIEELGNTGCASTAIALSQNLNKLKKDDLVGVTVFGGGYSCGSILIRV